MIEVMRPKEIKIGHADTKEIFETYFNGEKNFFADKIVCYERVGNSVENGSYTLYFELSYCRGMVHHLLGTSILLRRGKYTYLVLVDNPLIALESDRYYSCLREIRDRKDRVIRDYCDDIATSIQYVDFSEIGE